MRPLHEYRLEANQMRQKNRFAFCNEKMYPLNCLLFEVIKFYPCKKLSAAEKVNEKT